MTFLPAGEARLDLYTDALLLDINRDTFVVPHRGGLLHPPRGAQR